MKAPLDKLLWDNDQVLGAVEGQHQQLRGGARDGAPLCHARGCCRVHHKQRSQDSLGNVLNVRAPHVGNGSGYDIPVLVKYRIM
jgi:hypothetical protein